MKDEATPEQIEMARRVYTQFIIDNTPGAGPDDVPKFDDNAHGVRIALAAIIKTTRLASSMAADTLDKARAGEIDNDLRSIKHIIVGRFVDGDHLKGQDHG